MKTTFRILLFFLIITCCSSCMSLIDRALVRSAALKSLTIEEGNIPPYFEIDQSVLLVISKDQKYDKFIIKSFENYLGKYEILDREDVKKRKYEDKEEYRYIFGWSVYTQTRAFQAEFQVTHDYTKIHLYDRVEEKKYGSDNLTFQHREYIKAYIVNLNEIIENK